MNDQTDKIESKTAVIIASYGKSELTTRLVDQLWDEQALIDIYIVDNMGDYSDDRAFVIKPGENIGWLRACNLGAQTAINDGAASHLLFLNNDIVLCPKFIESMRLSWQLCEKPAIVAPMYDCAFRHQNPPQPLGKASEFVRKEGWRLLRTSIVDGTAFLISRENWKLAEGLDQARFGEYGWGADLSLAMQLRRHALHCHITEACYINHFRASTAHDVYGKGNYETQAMQAMRDGMQAKYGDNWEKLLYQGSYSFPI